MGLATIPAVIIFLILLAIVWGWLKNIIKRKEDKMSETQEEEKEKEVEEEKKETEEKKEESKEEEKKEDE